MHMLGTSYRGLTSNERCSHQWEVQRSQSSLFTVLWFYIQSTGVQDELLAPNEAQLRYQIYSGLAYGVKGYMYFTYLTKPYEACGNCHDALILRDGTKNDSYNWAKEINGEVLKLGPTLLSLTSQALYHTGS